MPARGDRAIRSASTAAILPVVHMDAGTVPDASYPLPDLQHAHRGSRMTSRSIWKMRGSSAFRAATRIVECPHCGAKYDVARDFDAHYQGACVTSAIADTSQAGSFARATERWGVNASTPGVPKMECCDAHPLSKESADVAESSEDQANG